MSLATAGSRIARRSAIALSYIRSSPSRFWVASGSTYGTDVRNCAVENKQMRSTMFVTEGDSLR
jgi:hypothetical protein